MLTCEQVAKHGTVAGLDFKSLRKEFLRNYKSHPRVTGQTAARLATCAAAQAPRDGPPLQIEHAFDFACDTAHMVGGMNRRGDQGNLAARSRVGRGADAPCPMRHVWVADPADRSGVKHPGLLVMWRRTQSGAGWEALVLYGVELRPGEWAVIQEWVNEAPLTQA